MNLSYRTERNAKAISASLGKPIDGKIPYVINFISDDESELIITDILGWPWNDINALVKDLSAITSSKILVRINSPGGDIIDTFSLYQALKSHPAKITTRIEALAASAASVLALAGDEVQAYSTSLMMIHNAWVVVAGNRYELQDAADLLEKIDTNIQSVYTSKTKIGKREVLDMMKTDTWLNAKEMKEKGFIDVIVDGKPVKAEFDLSVFGNLPEEFKEQKEHTVRDAERILRDAGFSRKEAKAMLAGRIDGDDSTHHIEKPIINDVDAVEIKQLLENLKLRIGV